jgi:predicted NACHT family NTPase
VSNLISYIPLFIGFIFMLAGIPAFLKLYEITQNLTTAIAMTIIYEIVVVVFSLISKVWQRVESKWVERLADGFDLSLQALFSGYRKRYLEYLVYQHRSFDVKGLSTQGPYNLELDGVYVQLNVDPTTMIGASANILQTEIGSGSHAIWVYINNQKIRGHNYAILGAPGSGKTTLLKHMALTLAAPSHRRRKIGAPNFLPILLFLRDHTKAIKDNSSIPLAQLIRDQFENRQAPLPPTGWLEKQLDRGKCLVMFDGLDEVADFQTRRQVVTWVEHCMVAYGKNRFVISSRPHGYKTNPLGNVTVLKVRPFATKQVEQFIHNWYLANEIMSAQKDDPGVREDARRGAADLIERIRSTSTLSDLAINPLLLTMITTVHRYRSSLPGRRVELYSEIFEVFLGKRQQARGLELDMTPAQKIRVLRQLAYAMMDKELRIIDRMDAIRIITKPLSAVNPKIKGEEFLQNVENSSGLLVEFESGKYSFSHLTFQEHLSSIHVIESNLEKELLRQVQNPWWHETIRLYCAQTDASNVIASCLNSSNASALSLAIECMDEAQEVSPEVRHHYEEVLEKGVEDPDPERRKLIATAWLKRRTG